MNQMTASRSRQSGVGMVEVMVAVLVLAIGVLGVAALQAITLKNSSSSASRSQAAIQIYSMMDIIRADRINIGSYNTNIYVAGDGSGEPGSKDGWLDGLKGSVAPDAQGKIVCLAEQMVCTVGVQWNDERATGGSGTEHIEITSQL